MSASPERIARKTQQRSLRTKQKLLDAALEAFSENGYKGTSTREIAARAGVHHPLITYHFSNKDRLWRSAVKYLFADFIGELEKARDRNSGAGPKAKFSAMIRAYLHHAARNPSLHRIIMQESSYQSDRLEWLCENFLGPLADSAERYVRDLQVTGVMPAGDSRLIYNMIRATTGTLIASSLELRATSNIDLRDSDKLDELVNLIEKFFLPGQYQAS